MGALNGVFGEDGGNAIAGAFRGARVVARVVDVVRVVNRTRLGFGMDVRADIVMNLNVEAGGMLLIDVGNFGRSEWNADEEEFICAARDDGGVVKARISAEDAGCNAALGGGFFATDSDDPVMKDGAVGVESFGEDGFDGKVVVGTAGVAVDEGRGGRHAHDKAEGCVRVVDDVEGFTGSGFGRGEGCFDGVAHAVGLTLDLRGDTHANLANLGGGVVNEIRKDKTATDVKCREKKQEKNACHDGIVRAN